MAFTDEQLKAINTDGTNIIVSAGAGSGKTAVLTERVIRKLRDGVDVSRLLVLTFTNEAANEMKTRIRKAIIDNKLDNQLNLLDSAYITTFDSFALSLVKKYHYLLNISKDINIIDSGVITIYKNKILDEIFLDMYGEELFDKLINDFCLKDDKSIKKYIIDCANKFDLLIDTDSYLDNYIDKYYNDKYIQDMTIKYLDIIKGKISELKELYDKFLDYINDNLIIKLDDWFKPLFNGDSYADYVLFKKKTAVRFVGVDEAGIPLKEEIKAKIDEINKLLVGEALDDLVNNYLKTMDYAKVIIDIIKKLNYKVSLYKNKHEIYEFNDISHMAIRIVSENKSIREEIRDYFNEIMIDEYQDTSIIQEEFINHISNNNVYMVGDIKQSIYRFRNANPYIFQDKYLKYSENIGGIKIDLLKNFRSRREVLFNINEIFNLIMDNKIGDADYLSLHNMVFGNTLYEIDNCPHGMMEIYNYNVSEDSTNEEKELFIISKDIQDKIDNKYQVFDKKTNKLRDITYSDICIITDRNKYLTTYKKILEYHKIPTVLYMDEELTNDMVIQVIKNLINLVLCVKDNIFDNKFRYLFTSVARSFLFDYNDSDIYDIITNKKFKETELIKLCSKIEIDVPLVNLIHDILNTFRVYERLLNLSDIDKNIVRINNLIDIASSMSIIGYSIYDFIDYLNDSIEMGLSIKYSSNTNSSLSVKIMNIHKSKGLEFSLCYFVGMYNKFTIKDISSKFLMSTKYGMILPYLNNNLIDNTFIREIYVNDYFREEISEKIRLLYVALTRCREKMIILAPLDMEGDNKYDKLVPDRVRIKYRSFLDILNSINVIDKYVINKDVIVDKNYDKITLRNIVNSDVDTIINVKNIYIKYKKIERERFSVKNDKIISLKEANDIEDGKKIHEIFEYADFRNSTNKYVNNFLKLIDNNFIKVYHEYEFIYNYGNEQKKGIIDLMIEYDNVIYIIDYKLRNTNKIEYMKQLYGYRDYIKSITNKDIRLFLYSIVKNELKEVL